MAHDPRLAAQADDKIARVLTSGSQDVEGEGGEQSTTTAQAPPITEYSVERVEKVYRFVPPPFLFPSPHLT